MTKADFFLQKKRMKKKATLLPPFHQHIRNGQFFNADEGKNPFAGVISIFEGDFLGGHFLSLPTFGYEAAEVKKSEM